MERISALLDVVERLYAATLTPSEWPDAMAAVQGLLGSEHVILRVHDAPGGGVDFGVNTGIDQASAALIATPEAAELAMQLFKKVPPARAMLRQEVVWDDAFER